MERSYWKLDKPLQKVLGQIRVKEEDRKRKNTVFCAEIENMVNEMKKNVVFKNVFRKLNYGGSTYENLKISAANEFDLNIELQLPFFKGNIVVENCLDTPGFVFVNVEDIDKAFRSNVDENIRQVIRKWFDPRGHLLRTKVYQWMHGVLDRALNTYQGPMKVKRSMSGPALTLHFEHLECGQFSVDLSPTFSFDRENWPKDPVRHWSKIPDCTNFENKNWFAVPKSPGNYQQHPELWRISFYQYEREMMNGKEQMKAVLKLMKYLRDKQDWKQISSYYLKTIFMLTQEKESFSFWKQGLGMLFMTMLGKIQFYLQKRDIPFFWNRDVNLIRKLNPEFPLKIANRIEKMKKRIIMNLDDEPEFVFIYFLRNISEQQECAQNNSFQEIIQQEKQAGGWCNIL